MIQCYMEYYVSGGGIWGKMLKRFVKNTFAFLVVFASYFFISEKGQAETLPDIPSTAAD